MMRVQLIDEREPPDWGDWTRSVNRQEPVTRYAAFEAGKARGLWEAYQVMNAVREAETSANARAAASTQTDSACPSCGLMQGNNAYCPDLYHSGAEDR